MNFEWGVRNHNWFPQNDDVYRLKYLEKSDFTSDVEELTMDNYNGKNDSYSITRDLNVLNNCDLHAIQTNTFYTYGTLQNDINEWMELSRRLQEDKRRISMSTLASDIEKYNENLLKAKRQVCGETLWRACYNFNSERYVKTKGYWSYDSYGNGTWHPTVYWQIEGYYGLWSTRGDNCETLASLITSMESQSGYSILNPKDWKSKIARKN